MTAPYILVVDDEPDIRDLVREILSEEGYEVEAAENGETARRVRRQRRPDLVLLDIWMPDVDGITLLKEWRESGGLPGPVIMMSGHGTVETAVEATRLGAWDFIEKPISLAKLLLTVERALEAHKLRRENEGLKRRIPAVSEPIGKSSPMRELREQARRLSQHDTWVLVRGEPGSGKETLARYMHGLSPRGSSPFVDMSPGSITPENAAVELFGSEEGEAVYYGRLEQAAGGTLFLDEVGDMNPETQVRLSSALEDGQFLRVGGSVPVSVDVRVVAASCRDLEEEMRKGRFREELFYRLNVVPLSVPPLRERSEDVPDLLHFYVDYFCSRENLSYRRFSVAAQNRLRQYDWPGNVRELRNLVQRLLIMGNAEEVDVAEVEGALGRGLAGDRREAPEGVYDLPLREAREQFERRYLQHQLRAVEGNVSRLAKAVGMERTHLYRKLRALGIDPKQVAAKRQ